MQLLFAPDTSDHPNWGGRLMGAWFRRAFATAGVGTVQTAPSAWFMQPAAALPELTTLAQIQRAADAIASGRILPEIAPLVRRCDWVMFNGENFLRPGALKGRRLLLLADLATRVLGKPSVLANHSVELGEPALAEILTDLYPRFAEVHAREQASFETCAGLVPSGRLRCVPDVAYTVPAAPPAAWRELAARPGHCDGFPDLAQRFDPTRPYLTVCPSSVFSLEAHLGLDPAPAYARLCRRLHDEVAPVLLVASCVVDARIMRRVQAATGMPLLGLNFPVRQGIDVLGGAEVHVGGRWHPSIFAATGGAPTVAFATNSRKMHALMEQLGLDGPVFDPLELDGQVDAIVAQARRLVDAGEPLRQRLRMRCATLAAQVPSGLDWLRTAVRQEDRGQEPQPRA